jgi:hypothetical protein
MRRAGCSNPVTWGELARTFSLRALLQLAGFPLGLKAQQKVIDITEQFEETQSQIPPMVVNSQLSWLIRKLIVVAKSIKLLKQSPS